MDIKRVSLYGDTSNSDSICMCGGRLEGYASLFGVIDRGGDIVEAGAFQKSIASAKGKISFLWQHDPLQPIGVIDNIYEDKTGLFISARITTSTRCGYEALRLAEEGVIDGLSIGYNVMKARQGKSARYLTEIDLWEVSLVTFPMQTGARGIIAKDESRTNNYIYKEKEEAIDIRRGVKGIIDNLSCALDIISSRNMIITGV